MSKQTLALCALLISIAVVPFPIRGQDDKAVVSAAAKAMGAENLKTIQLTGSGSAAGIGQNVNPTSSWPTVRVKSYTRQIDVDALASNLQSIRVQNNADVPLNQVIPSNAPWPQQYDLWVTPYAFLKGAMTNPVTVRPGTLDGVKYTVVSFNVQNKYRVEGYINDQNMVARVRTWIDNEVLGDMLVDALYNDYKDFGGVKVPTVLIVKQGGFATLILIVSDAKANVPVTIPAAPAPAAAPAVAVETEKIADGVYYLKGGTHHSVLVEFGDHVTLIEAPQNEARSLALLAEIKKLYPNKPLTEVVNTHHHFDHSGGLRTFVDAGATIITHESNKAFLEQSLAAPRTVQPDKLAQSGKKATVEGMQDKRVLSDATRVVELHPIQGTIHDDGIIMAYLPKEKILVEADVYIPAAPNAALPTQPNPNNVALYDNIERLKLTVDQILPMHGRKVPLAELQKSIGKAS